MSIGGALVGCSIQVLWVQVHHCPHSLSIQILFKGGAVEDGHQNTGRVSPFSDPWEWYSILLTFNPLTGTIKPTLLYTPLLYPSTLPPV